MVTFMHARMALGSSAHVETTSIGSNSWWCDYITKVIGEFSGHRLADSGTNDENSPAPISYLASENTAKIRQGNGARRRRKPDMRVVHREPPKNDTTGLGWSISEAAGSFLSDFLVCDVSYHRCPPGETIVCRLPARFVLKIMVLKLVLRAFQDYRVVFDLSRRLPPFLLFFALAIVQCISSLNHARRIHSSSADNTAPKHHHHPELLHPTKDGAAPDITPKKCNAAWQKDKPGWFHRRRRN